MPARPQHHQPRLTPRRDRALQQRRLAQPGGRLEQQRPPPARADIAEQLGEQVELDIAFQQHIRHRRSTVGRGLAPHDQSLLLHAAASESVAEPRRPLGDETQLSTCPRGRHRREGMQEVRYPHHSEKDDSGRDRRSRSRGQAGIFARRPRDRRLGRWAGAHVQTAASRRMEQSASTSPTVASVLVWTAMKEGLLGDRLGVSSRSEHEEARFVCCTLDWI